MASGSKNWDAIVAKTDEDDESKRDIHDLFRNCYATGDADSKRAMLKSYTESNGTVLSTNWKEVEHANYHAPMPSASPRSDDVRTHV